MRQYTDKKNAQAKAYYSDRFYKSPQLESKPPSSDKVFNEDIKSIKSVCKVKDASIVKGQLVFFIEPQNIKKVLKHLRDELDYTILSEVSAIDWIEKSNQFEIFYQMLSMNKRKRLRVKMFIDNGVAVDSVTSLFNSANWPEREMFDMYGIRANNHPYMKRLIMPDDWTGHPLLKSYPLIGDEAAQWYEIDTIFGKDYRAIIGPEIRDTKRIDPKDTKNFARVGCEVRYGEKPTNKPTNYGDYQEEGGVPLIDRFTKDKQKILKSRK